MHPLQPNSPRRRNDTENWNLPLVCQFLSSAFAFGVHFSFLAKKPRRKKTYLSFLVFLIDTVGSRCGLFQVKVHGMNE